MISIVRAVFWCATGVLVTVGAYVVFRGIGVPAPAVTSAATAFVTVIGLWLGLDRLTGQLRAGGLREHWPTTLLLALMLAAFFVWTVYVVMGASTWLRLPNVLVVLVFVAGAVGLAVAAPRPLSSKTDSAREEAS